MTSSPAGYSPARPKWSSRLTSSKPSAADQRFDGVPAVFLRRIGLFVASKTGRGIVAEGLPATAGHLDKDTVESFDRRLAESERCGKRTLYVAVLALAIAIGHVVYAAVRDHVFDGSIF